MYAGNIVVKELEFASKDEAKKVMQELILQQPCSTRKFAGIEKINAYRQALAIIDGWNLK